MFKKGDKVVFVNATYADRGQPSKGGEQSIYYSRYMNITGVIESEIDGFGCITVALDNDCSVSSYAWRFELIEKEEWILAPEGYEFKVGEEVKIGELISERENGFPIYVGINERMRKLEGMTTTVNKITHAGIISLSNGEGYNWNPRWLKVKNKIANRPMYMEGDKVVVARKAIIANGPKWIKEQDECLNEEGVITKIDKKAYQIKTMSGEWWYCAEAFVKSAKFFRDGGKLKRDEAVIAADIEKVVEKFIKDANAWSGAHGICAFSTFNIDDQNRVKANNTIGGPCHAGLHRYNHREIIGAIDFPYFGIAGKYEDDWTLFADYIINRSQFRIAFHPTPIEDVKTKGVRLNVEATSDQVAAGCIALRHGTEWSGHVKQFAWLVREKGMSEDAAWLSAYMVQAIDAKHTTFQNALIGGGHQVISGGMPQDVVFKFIKHGFPDLKRKPYRADSNYKVTYGIGYDSYREGPGPNPLSDFRNKHAKGKEEGSGWDATTKIDEETVINFTKLIHEQLQKA